MDGLLIKRKFFGSYDRSNTLLNPSVTEWTPCFLMSSYLNTRQHHSSTSKNVQHLFWCTSGPTCPWLPNRSYRSQRDWDSPWADMGRWILAVRCPQVERQKHENHSPYELVARPKVCPWSHGVLGPTCVHPPLPGSLCCRQWGRGPLRW